MADDALHRFHMVETPELEIVGHVHQRFAGFVTFPVRAAVVVDGAQHRDYGIVVVAHPAEIPLEHVARHHHPATRQVRQEFVVQPRRLERLLQALVPLRLVPEVVHHGLAPVAEAKLENPVLR